MRARQKICARDYGSYEGVHARIFTKKNLVVNSYLINLSFKFRKDLSFRWGDIPLFVTVHDLELKILSFSNPSKNAILSGKKHTLIFIFFKPLKNCPLQWFLANSHFCHPTPHWARMWHFTVNIWYQTTHIFAWLGHLWLYHSIYGEITTDFEKQQTFFS